MSGKIYTLLPALNYEALLTASLLASTVALVVVLVTLTFFADLRKEG